MYLTDDEKYKILDTVRNKIIGHTVGAWFSSYADVDAPDFIKWGYDYDNDAFAFHLNDDGSVETTDTYHKYESDRTEEDLEDENSEGWEYHYWSNLYEWLTDPYIELGNKEKKIINMLKSLSKEFDKDLLNYTNIRTRWDDANKFVDESLNESTSDPIWVNGFLLNEYNVVCNISTSAPKLIAPKGSIAPTDCSQLFQNCEALEIDLRNLDTSYVTNMRDMFANCEYLVSLNLSSFDTSKVTDMRHMFYDCESLVSLDLSNFDTSRVTRMDRIFSSCFDIRYIDLSSFNTSNVKNMSEMFCHCKSLTSLDLSNFNTSNVTDMSNMFFNCTSLQSLDLSNFNTSNVTSMRGMFFNCDSLTSLDLSSFDSSKVEDMRNMFNFTSFDQQAASNFIDESLNEGHHLSDFSSFITWTPIYGFYDHDISKGFQNIDTDKLQELAKDKIWAINFAEYIGKDEGTRYIAWAQPGFIGGDGLDGTIYPDGLEQGIKVAAFSFFSIPEFEFWYDSLIHESSAFIDESLNEGKRYIRTDLTIGYDNKEEWEEDKETLKSQNIYFETPYDKDDYSYIEIIDAPFDEKSVENLCQQININPNTIPVGAFSFDESLDEDYYEDDDWTTYRARVTFAGMIGVEEILETEDLDVDSARKDLEEEAKNLLSVEDVVQDDEDDMIWHVTVNFAGYIGADEEYEVIADNEDEASDQALIEAECDLGIEMIDEDDEEYDIDGDFNADDFSYVQTDVEEDE